MNGIIVGVLVVALIMFCILLSLAVVDFMSGSGIISDNLWTFSLTVFNIALLTLLVSAFLLALLLL
jgi:hypothetical protein